MFVVAHSYCTFLLGQRLGNYMVDPLKIIDLSSFDSIAFELSQLLVHLCISLNGLAN